MIFCGKRVAGLNARISHLVDSRAIHVHEFPLINALVLTFLLLLHFQAFRPMEKYQRDDGGEQHIDHDGKATTHHSESGVPTYSPQSLL